MYLLFLYIQETLYLKLKLINLNFLNATQRKGILEELKTVFIISNVYVHIASKLMLSWCCSNLKKKSLVNIVTC